MDERRTRFYRLKRGEELGLQGEKRRRTRTYWVEREEGALGFTG